MRPLQPDELEIILHEVSRRGNDVLAKDLEKASRVLLLDDANQLHLCSAALAGSQKVLAANPTALGEPWGRLEKGRWTPTLAAMVHIGAATRWRRVVISDTAAQHFLYGKGIHKENILQREPDVGVGDEVWVCDPTGAVLGRARVQKPSEKSLDVLKPIDDLGWYLREGG